MGYSMGTSRYFTLLAERPEYNAKVKAGFLMGPAASMTYASHPILDLAEQAEELQDNLHQKGEGARPEGLGARESPMYCSTTEVPLSSLRPSPRVPG